MLTIPGMVMDYAGPSIPTGWLLCDGSSVSRTTYADLFNAVTTSTGCTTYNGLPTVEVPDASLFGVGWRVELSEVSGGFATIIGLNTGTNTLTLDKNATSSSGTFSINILGIPWGAADSTHFNLPDLRRRVLMGSGGTQVNGPGIYLGNTGGAEGHTLTTGEMPAHTHGIPFSATSGLAGGPNFNLSGASGATTTSTGGGGSHNNVQPSAVVKKIIKV